jgi:hypothetical protein
VAATIILDRFIEFYKKDKNDELDFEEEKEFDELNKD